MKVPTKTLVGFLLTLRFIVDLYRYEIFGLQLLFDTFDVILLIGMIKDSKLLMKVWIFLTCITTMLKATMPFTTATIFKVGIMLILNINSLELIWYCSTLGAVLLVISNLRQNEVSQDSKVPPKETTQII